MRDWLKALAAQLRQGEAVVRIVVAAVRGSAPREAGASMLVGGADSRLYGTIGGGHLEWKAIAIARQMQAQVSSSRLDRYTLGATLGQCCGGAVELWFERYDFCDLAFIEEALAQRGSGPTTLTTLITSSGETALTTPRRCLQLGVAEATARFSLHREDDRTVCVVERIDPEGLPLWLFGAGHVGTALVRVLSGLPLRITWVDSREEQFEALGNTLPENVTPLLSDDPAEEVAYAPSGSHFLVLTHSHDLDDVICRAIMQRDDVHWAGLIGSHTKAASFAGRWERYGYTRAEISRITCPIGIPGIASKEPAAIAIAVAAQLQQAIEARAAGVTTINSAKINAATTTATLAAAPAYTPAPAHAARAALGAN